MNLHQQLAGPAIFLGVVPAVVWFFELAIALLRGEQGTIFPRRRGR